MPRYFARYNVDAGAWEVFDTHEQKAVESFPCRQHDELRHYAEHRALAHACRLNDLDARRDRLETGDPDGPAS